MGTDPANPSPRELPLSNQTRFSSQGQDQLLKKAAPQPPAESTRGLLRGPDGRHGRGDRLTLGGQHISLAQLGNNLFTAMPPLGHESLQSGPNSQKFRIHPEGTSHQ